MLFLIPACALAQCDDSDNGDDQGEGGGGDDFNIPVLHAFDPNDITGPEGYDTVRWVSINDRMGYTIRFENDPEFATAPAQKVVVKHAIPETINPFTLQLGSFGFGEFFFDVPSGSTNYSSRLNVIDSLGVYVDITAGLDVANKEAFWIFQSIDPATGLASTVPADLGFLPVNDTTLNRFNDTIPKAGEGFVSFTVLPKSTDITGDSVNAQANIFFDFNAPIATNIWTNIVDALPPTSIINPMSPNQDSTIIELTWQGMDDPGGCGIAYYDLYASVNDAPFELVADNLTGTSYTFQGEAGSDYQFFTLATDNVGNSEVKYTADVSVTPLGRYVFDIRTLLEGAYDASGFMSTTLNSLGLIPNSQPYSNAPWNYAGTESVSSIPMDVVDWVLVQVRASEASVDVLDTKAALLKNDGQLVGTNEENINFSIDGDYDSLYVAVYHRNHVGVMSAAKIARTNNNTFTIDFTQSTSNVFGGANSIADLGDGYYGLISGDADGNGQVQVTDFNQVLQDLGISGYLPEDFNLNSQVQNTDLQNQFIPNLGRGASFEY